MFRNTDKEDTTISVNNYVIKTVDLALEYVIGKIDGTGQPVTIDSEPITRVQRHKYRVTVKIQVPLRDFAKSAGVPRGMLDRVARESYAPFVVSIDAYEPGPDSPSATTWREMDVSVSEQHVGNTGDLIVTCTVPR